MCDMSKRKSSGYCRSRNTLRTVTTTKWELPIPGSKPYWDKICDDLEQRKEHVSDSSCPPSPSSNLLTYPNTILNRHQSISRKSNYIVEPIVKISPPTPMRIAPQSEKFIISDHLTIKENANDHDSILKESYSSDSLRSVNVSGKKYGNLSDISMCMTEILRNSNVQTKESCQLHKNTPPLQIFDDNLKRFLPKKMVQKKSPSSNKIYPRLSSDILDVSKLHRNDSCPLSTRPVSNKGVETGTNLTATRNRTTSVLRRSKTAGPGKRKVKTSFDNFLKIPESSYVNPSLHSKYRKLNKKSKSEILTSNVNHILSIPKLNDFMFNDEATANLDSQDHHAQVIFPYSLDTSHSETWFPEKSEECFGNETDLPKLTEMKFATSYNEQPEKNEQVLNKNVIGARKYQDKQRKNFLKVPKLGKISTYPSFNKLTPGDSVEADESAKQIEQESFGDIVSQKVENPLQEIEPCKRDYLKVPRLSIINSYPSFTSLNPESLDSDDNAVGASELFSRRADPETSSNVSGADEKSTDHNESTDPKELQNEKISPIISFSQTGRSKRRRSLKDSVRYAYRALKFLTPNKKLDFQPQGYIPTVKSSSSIGSSGSSRDSKYSKFEPAIKLLTYEDINQDRPFLRSVSSSTYGTVRSRLKQSASRYLGPNYVFSSPRGRPATPSTTIPSLTRSTSGPTLDFQEPILKRPSEKLLSILPKMSIFPRKKYDKCLACLHKSFKEPVQSVRELPLATLTAVIKDTVPILSESESSSISLPDIKELMESQSEYEDNWTDVMTIRSARKSPPLNKGEMRSPLRTNVDLQRSRHMLVRTSEESQSLKSDGKIDDVKKNVSSKDSIATNTHSKAMSLSSDHSKHSSASGHSSESDEPQVQIKQALPTSECFVSPLAPLHWVPSLDPLKSLKLRKPVSMHGRAVSLTKIEDDTTSDDNANDYRSARKETKTSTKKVTDQNEPSDNIDLSSKSDTKFRDKPSLEKQTSNVTKILASQVSIVAHLGKTQSRIDLFSNDSKSENQATTSIDTDEKIRKDTVKSQKQEEANLPDEKSAILGTDDKKRTMNSEMHLHSVDVSNYQYVDPQSPTSKAVLPQIDEQSIENENAMGNEDREKVAANLSTELQEDKVPAEESQDLAEEAKIYSNKRVIEVLENCIEENRTPFQMLEALSVIATQSDPFSSKEMIENSKIAHSAKIARNLIKLLTNSKKYLNPDTFSPHLQFSSPQIPLCNPRQLRRVLPTKTYNLVARILGMPEDHIGQSRNKETDPKPSRQTEDPFKHKQTRSKGPATDSCDMIVHPPSPRSGRNPIIDKDDFEYPKQSPYALFMNKPRRKAIKWRPLTERDMLGYDPEATLNMRATRLTNKICEDFCQWLRGLGGGHSEDIDEEVLKDMFQIEFTAEACRTMQVLIREIPMVPMAVALARNTPGAGELALTRKHLISDAKAERLPKKFIGFGSMLPQADRFIPPKNRVNERWLQCENVPRDLETMETVWKGITHLNSVKGFLAWLKAHPEVKPPKILMDAQAKKEAHLEQLSIEEASGHTVELEMDQIESLKVGDV